MASSAFEAVVRLATVALLCLLGACGGAAEDKPDSTTTDGTVFVPGDGSPPAHVFEIKMPSNTDGFIRPFVDGVEVTDELTYNVAFNALPAFTKVTAGPFRISSEQDAGFGVKVDVQAVYAHPDGSVLSANGTTAGLDAPPAGCVIVVGTKLPGDDSPVTASIPPPFEVNRGYNLIASISGCDTSKYSISYQFFAEREVDVKLDSNFAAFETPNAEATDKVHVEAWFTKGEQGAMSSRIRTKPIAIVVPPPKMTVSVALSAESPRSDVTATWVATYTCTAYDGPVGAYERDCHDDEEVQLAWGVKGSSPVGFDDTFAPRDFSDSLVVCDPTKFVVQAKYATVLRASADFEVLPAASTLTLAVAQDGIFATGTLSGSTDEDVIQPAMMVFDDLGHAELQSPGRDLSYRPVAACGAPEVADISGSFNCPPRADGPRKSFTYRAGSALKLDEYPIHVVDAVSRIGFDFRPDLDGFGNLITLGDVTLRISQGLLQLAIDGQETSDLMTFTDEEPAFVELEVNDDELIATVDGEVLKHMSKGTPGAASIGGEGPSGNIDHVELEAAGTIIEVPILVQDWSFSRTPGSHLTSIGEQELVRVVDDTVDCDEYGDVALTQAPDVSDLKVSNNGNTITVTGTITPPPSDYATEISVLLLKANTPEPAVVLPNGFGDGRYRFTITSAWDGDETCASWTLKTYARTAAGKLSPRAEVPLVLARQEAVKCLPEEGCSCAVPGGCGVASMCTEDGHCAIAEGAKICEDGLPETTGQCIDDRCVQRLN